MNNIRKYELKHLLASIIIWIIALQVFLFIRFSGYSPETIKIIAPKVLRLFWHNMPLAFIAGGLMGTIFGLLELYVFKTKWKHISFYKVLIFRLFTYLVSLIFITTFIAFTYNLLIKTQTPAEAFHGLNDFLKNEHYIIISAYGLLVSLTLFFFGQMNKKIGDGEIFNIVRGKYHHPKEECRYFMFLDLEDSTHIASVMGHVKFSEMLQDVYAQMSKFVIMYEATIYQHVGDEVVLTWRCLKMPQKPLQFFFAFENFLSNKQHDYRKMYGFAPRFRASLNAGIVTVAEAGVTKKETVFHGDVLNVAARVQKLCKEYDASFLTTNNVAKMIKPPIDGISVKKIGYRLLKGKSEKTAVFNIKRDETQGKSGMLPE